MVYQGGAPLAQRCLSDPGANSPTDFNEKGFKEHCLGEDTLCTEMPKEKHLAFFMVNKSNLVHFIFFFY